MLNATNETSHSSALIAVELLAETVEIMRKAGFAQAVSPYKEGIHARFLNAAGDEIVALFEDGKVFHWQVQREHDWALGWFNTVEEALAFCVKALVPSPAPLTWVERNQLNELLAEVRRAYHHIAYRGESTELFWEEMGHNAEYELEGLLPRLKQFSRRSLKAQTMLAKAERRLTRLDEEREN